MKPKIGLLVTAMLEDENFSVAHLRPKMSEVTTNFERLLSRSGEIVNPGFVENEPEAERAAQIFSTSNVDLIVVVELAYQKDAIPLRTLLDTNAPVLIWNTQQIRSLPENADFDLISFNSGIAGVPGLTSALLRSKRRFSILTSHMSDQNGLTQLDEYATASAVIRRLRSSRVGVIGHPYEGMTDLVLDGVSLRSQVGPETWPVEPERVAVAAANMPADKVSALVKFEQSRFRTQDMTPELFDRSARLALALEQIAGDYRLDAVATIEQVWLKDPRVGIIASYGTGRLDSLGIPSTPEGDISTAVSMLILKELAGRSSIVENYTIDFDNNCVFLSHDGTGNPDLATSPSEVAIKPTIYYPGVKGNGASFEFAYAPGPVTFLSLVNLGNGGWRFVAAEGESLPLKLRPIGAPQMMFRYSGGTIDDYCDRWCSAGGFHHQAVAYGKLGSKIRKVGELLGLESIII